MSKISRILDSITKRAELAGYDIVQHGKDGNAFRGAFSLLVIVSIAKEKDNRYWLHVSSSYPNRKPDYDKMLDIKDIFIGIDKKAIQIFPSKDEYVNLCQYALHLWHCIDGDPLPDFRGKDGLI